MGRIITIVVFVVLIVFCFWWWHSNHQPNPYDGSVRRDPSMETGATTMETVRNPGAEVHPTPSRSDAPGTVNGEPYNPEPDDNRASPIAPKREDPYSRDRRTDEGDAGNEYPRPDHFGRRPAGPVDTAPAQDTQPPDNPDGEHFGGEGVYQLYRQGNLTYRMNTRTGQSCILYATMEEWRKPFVYRHGCRAR